jgi:hypothetical protein
LNSTAKSRSELDRERVLFLEVEEGVRSLACAEEAGAEYDALGIGVGHSHFERCLRWCDFLVALDDRAARAVYGHRPLLAELGLEVESLGLDPGASEGEARARARLWARVRARVRRGA